MHTVASCGLGVAGVGSFVARWVENPFSSLKIEMKLRILSGLERKWARGQHRTAEEKESGALPTNYLEGVDPVLEPVEALIRRLAN